MSDEINPLSQAPVFEYDQVITTNDLIKIKTGLIKARHHFVDNNYEDDVIAIETMLDFTDVLLEWVLAGKPNSMKLKGDCNEAEPG